MAGGQSAFAKAEARAKKLTADKAAMDRELLTQLLGASQGEQKVVHKMARVRKRTYPPSSPTWTRYRRFCGVSVRRFWMIRGGGCRSLVMSAAARLVIGCKPHCWLMLMHCRCWRMCEMPRSSWWEYACLCSPTCSQPLRATCRPVRRVWSRQSLFGRL